MTAAIQQLFRQVAELEGSSAQQAAPFHRDDADKRQRSSDIVPDTSGDDFPGILVSDCLVVYDKLNFRKHKCIAHHLRAIHNARERPDTKDPSYLDRLKGFFKTVILLHGLLPRPRQ